LNTPSDRFLASSAREGLWKFQQVTPDVILADLGMPMEDGYWFIKEVRKLDPAPRGRVMIIALTAYGQEHERTALAAGFDHFMEKPVELEQLCNIIENLTTATRTARAS
jgi:CheY-like chemotaxis protein